MTDIATLLSRDAASVWHPYTRFSSLGGHHLPVIVCGDGVHLVAADGTRYVDAISSWWCCALGHGHPAIVEAIRDQAGRLQHSILGNLTHPSAIELAEGLARRMPTPDRHTLFASDGSSAVEQAVKIAVQYRHNTGEPHRRRIACFEAAYHGDTLGAMSLGYVEAFHRPFYELLFDAVRMPFPACPCRNGGTTGDTCADCFSPARAVLDAHAESLTAVVVEPMVQGAAGMRMHGAAWLCDLAAWCRDHDVLLVLDEIATGFSRTGPRFAFHHADGVDPDILCLGKALTGGALPLSATVVKDRLYETFADLDEDYTLQHGHTFCGNPIAAAAANAALAAYEDPVLVANAATLAHRLAAGLAPCRELPGVRNVRCLGVIGAVELEPHAGPPAESRAHAVRRRLQERGVLLRPIGDVLYLMPPLVTPPGVMDELIAVFVEAIAETADG